jgi:predicted nucleic acid-binding protein
VIVVDASAVLEFLLQTALGTRIEARLYRDHDEFNAPHLLDVEVCQALRRLVRLGDVSVNRAQEALSDLVDLDIRRHAHIQFLDRAWDLRNNLTAYDAMYVALAEALDAPLVTCDAPLGAALGHQSQIEVIS